MPPYDMEQNRKIPKVEHDSNAEGKPFSLSHILRPITITALIATPLLIILRILLFIFGYDDSLSVWTRNANTLGSLSIWLMIAVAVAVWVMTKLILRKQSPGAVCPIVSSGIVNTFIALFAASLMVVTSISAAMTMKNDGELAKIQQLFVIFFPLTGIISFIGTSYRLLTNGKKDAISIVTGFFPPIWVCLSMLESYFSTGHIINDPALNGELLASVFLILFLLAEQKMRIVSAEAASQDAADNAAWMDGLKMYLPAVTIAASIGFSLSFPVLLSALIGPVHFECSLLKIGTECMLSLSAFARLISISRNN